MSVVTVVFLALGAVAVLGILALGLWYPGSGAEQLGWRSSRSHAEADAIGDAEDLEQMLEAANARRRARGERELTVDGLVEEELRDRRARRRGGDEVQ